MNTDFAWTIGLEIPRFLVELLLRERNFGHTHLQSTLVSDKNGFVYLNKKWTMSYPGQLDWRFPLFLMSYYYKSVILVIHTHTAFAVSIWLSLSCENQYVLWERHGSISMLRRRQVGGWSYAETRRTSVEGVLGQEGAAPLGRISDGGRIWRGGSRIAM